MCGIIGILNRAPESPDLSDADIARRWLACFRR
jgi:hypothetical protein